MADNATPQPCSDAVSTEKQTRQRYFLAFVLFVVVFFSYIDRVNVSILVADNAFLADMGIVSQAVQKGMLMSVFLFAYMFGNVLLGPHWAIFWGHVKPCVSRFVCGAYPF